MSSRLVAELFGTYMLVFFGTGAMMSNAFPKANFGILGIAFAFGIAYAVAVSATMGISGGHLNPALTAGMLAVRRIDARTALLYIVAQLLGAVLASFTIKLVLPVGVTKVLSLGAPAIAATITLGQAIAIEAIFTFFLMSALLGTMVSAVAPRVAGFGVGLTLFIGVLVAGPLTGGALNPARAFAPALVSGQWISQGVFWIGPILGAVIAAFVWEKLLFPRATD